VYSFFDFITSGNCDGLGSYPLWLGVISVHRQDAGQAVVGYAVS
jgi:hypothetical protein